MGLKSEGALELGLKSEGALELGLKLEGALDSGLGQALAELSLQTVFQRASFREKGLAVAWGESGQLGIERVWQRARVRVRRIVAGG